MMPQSQLAPWISCMPFFHPRVKRVDLGHTAPAWGWAGERMSPWHRDEDLLALCYLGQEWGWLRDEVHLQVWCLGNSLCAPLLSPRRPLHPHPLKPCEEFWRDSKASFPVSISLQLKSKCLPDPWLATSQGPTWRPLLACLSCFQLRKDTKKEGGEEMRGKSARKFIGNHQSKSCSASFFWADGGLCVSISASAGGQGPWPCGMCWWQGPCEMTDLGLEMENGHRW